MPLYCGCCDCGAVDKQHFDTTEHHLKALGVWCKSLSELHNFGKGYVNEPLLYEKIFIPQILTTRLILFNRQVPIDKIESIIKTYLDKCKECGIFIPKDMDKTLLGKRSKIPAGLCPDCFYGNKVTHVGINGGSE